MTNLLNISAVRRRTRLTWPAYLCLVLLTGLPVAAADEQSASEHAVKAALIYKIAKFVSWPSTAFTTPGEPLSVCLPAMEPIGPALNALTGKTVRGRQIKIRRFDATEPIASDCKILFLSQLAPGRRAALVSGVADAPVLTIGDTEDFVDLGGIVTLKIRQNRIQFAINIDASNRAGLDISAQLLQLATIKNGGSRH